MQKTYIWFSPCLRVEKDHLLQHRAERRGTVSSHDKEETATMTRKTGRSTPNLLSNAIFHYLAHAAATPLLPASCAIDHPHFSRRLSRAFATKPGEFGKLTTTMTLVQ